MPRLTADGIMPLRQRYLDAAAVAFIIDDIDGGRFLLRQSGSLFLAAMGKRPRYQ